MRSHRGASWAPFVVWVMSCSIFAGILSAPAGAGTVRVKRPVQLLPGQQSQPQSQPQSQTHRELSTPAAEEHPHFPHLLVARDANHHRLARGAVDLCVAPSFDPASGLPPSVLPEALRRRAERLFRAPADRFAAEQQATERGVSGAVTVRVCVLRVDFLEDTPGTKTTGDGRFMLTAPDSTDPSRPLVDPPPHNRAYFAAHMEALRRYYDVQSDGFLNLEFDIWPAEEDSAYHLSDTFRYGPWIFSNSNPDVFQHAIDLVGDALAAADSTSPEIDFRTYDSFVIFHAGADFQGDLNGDSPWDIPSFNLAVSEPFIVGQGDEACGVDYAAVLPETESQDGFEGALNSVIAHEFGHQLGFFDFYDVFTGNPFVGAYSLMDSGTNLYATLDDPRSPGELVAVRGMVPPSLDPWHKAIFLPTPSVQLLSVTDLVFDDVDSFEVALPASNIRNEVLYLPLNLAEYYLIENRKIDLNGDSTLVLRSDPETGVILGPEPDSTKSDDPLAFREYDYLLPGEGILVWHADQKAISAGLSADFGGINVFYSRPGVGLVEADGIRDIGGSSAEFLGGPFDPYFVGGYTHLGPETVPSSDTNDGTESGLELAVLDSIGVSMRIAGRFGQGIAGWPLSLTAAPRDGQVVPFDLELDGRTEILAVSGRSILAFRDNGEPYRDDTDALFLRLSSPIESRLAVAQEMSTSTGPQPIVAAVGGGVLWLVSGDARIAAAWPVGQSLVTSEPALSDSLAWIGCADGEIRGIGVGFVDPERVGFPVIDRAVGSIAVGRPETSGALRFAWASEDGREYGGFSWSSSTGRRFDEWNEERDEVADGGSNSADSSGGADPVGLLILGRDDGAHTLLGWSDGRIEWRNADGGVLDGWPRHVDGRPVGAPIVADADQDGVLETIVLTDDGTIHMFGWNGVLEAAWPRSIWSEDDLDPPVQTAELRAWDVDGDEAIDLLVHREDGFVVALRGDGTPTPGWPLSIGPRALHGPDYIAATEATGTRMVLGNLFGSNDRGESIEMLTVLRRPLARIDLPGAFPTPGVDLRRSGVYPAALRPQPRPAESTAVEARAVLYPNPLREDHLTIQVTVDAPTVMRLDAFDLTGAHVAETAFDLAPGANGNFSSWDLSRLAPGLYHVRVRVEGGAHPRDEFHRLAVAR